MAFRIRRIHDAPSPDDGARLLVDRLWPRGVSKERAALDGWPKAVTPSTELRKWFHAGGDWETFEVRYRTELQDAADELEALRAQGADGTVTLLTANKDMERNHAHVLLAVLEGH